MTITAASWAPEVRRSTVPVPKREGRPQPKPAGTKHAPKPTG